MTSPPRPFRRQVLVNTMSSAVSNIWAMVVMLVALPLTLAGLGAELFGTWVLISTFSATNGWFSLADLGVGVSTTRSIAGSCATGDDASARRTASSSLLALGGLGVTGALLLSSVGVLALPWVFGVSDDVVHAMRVALLVYSIQVIADLCIHSLQASLDGLNRVDLSKVIDILRRTLTAVGTAAAALATGSLVVTAAASLIASCGSLLVSLAVLRRRMPGGLSKPQIDEARRLVRDGRAVALLRPLGVIQRTMDRVIVGVMLGPAAVTLVEIATQLQAAADAILSSSINAVVPASSWLDRSRGPTAMAELAERGTKYSLLVTAPVVVAVATLSGPLVEVWLDGEFDAAAGLASLAVLSVALAAPVAVGSQMLLGTGRAASIARAASVALVANLVVSVLLVSQIGTAGVFVGTLVGALLLLPMLGLPILDLIGTGAGQFARAAVLPVAVPVIAQTSVSAMVLLQGWGPVQTLIIGALAGFATYAAAALVVAIRPSELSVIRGELSRRSSRSD